jgi:hypothetical protein
LTHDVGCGQDDLDGFRHATSLAVWTSGTSLLFYPFYLHMGFFCFAKGLF